MKATQTIAALTLVLGCSFTAHAADGVIKQDEAKVQQDKQNVQTDKADLNKAKEGVAADKASGTTKTS